MWFTGSPVSVTGDLLQSSHERIRLSRICCDEMRNACAESMERIYESMDRLQSIDIPQLNGASRVRTAQIDRVTEVFFHRAGSGDAADNFD
jgi:hypothetical protein